MLPSISNWIVTNRFLVLTLLSVATLVAACFAPRIQFEFTPQSLYEGNDEQIQYAEAFHAEFPTDDLAILVVGESVGSADCLAPEFLTWQKRFASRLDSLPQVVRVSSVASLRLPRPRIFPPFFLIAPIVPQAEATEEDSDRLRAVLAENGLFDRVLISPNRRVSATLAFLPESARDIEDMRAAVEATQDLLAQHPVPEGFRAHLTGLPLLRVQVIRDLEREQVYQVPLVGLLFVILLALIFRSLAGIVMPLVAVGSAVAWTIAVMVWMGLTFNLITNVLPVLLLVIGISNCVHFVSRYYEAWVANKGDQLAAARETISYMAVACFLTCLTTALGFLSLCFAGSASLREFGSEAALGMAFLYISTLLWLGAALPLFRTRHAGSLGSSEESKIARSVAGLGAAAARQPYFTLLAAFVVVCVIAFSQRLVVDSRIIETYEAQHPVHVTLNLIEDHLSGVTALEVSLQADTSDRLFEPEVFTRVARFVDFAESQDEILKVHSYVNVFQQLYRQVRRSDPNREHLPSLDEAGAKRIAWSRRLARRLAGSMQYRALMSSDESRARLICRMRDAGSSGTLAVIGACEAELSRLFPSDQPVRAQVTGEAYLHAHAMDLLIRDVFYSLCGVSAVIFVIIGMLFRSLRIGLISIVPNLTPLIITLGYMGWCGYELNVGNVIVFAISIGIAVDDTIHFLTRFREELQLGVAPQEAVRKTLLSAGRAIVLTSVIVVLGLSVMFFSEFMPTRRFAELMSVTMAAALVGDLVLLPACVAVLWRRSVER